MKKKTIILQNSLIAHEVAKYYDYLQAFRNYISIYYWRFYLDYDVKHQEVIDVKVFKNTVHVIIEKGREDFIR